MGGLGTGSRKGGGWITIILMYVTFKSKKTILIENVIEINGKLQVDIVRPDQIWVH